MHARMFVSCFAKNVELIENCWMSEMGADTIFGTAGCLICRSVTREGWVFRGAL